MATDTAAIEEPLGYTVIFYEDAKKDIIEIAKWYDLQMDGLGNRFEKYLGEAVQKLTTHPTAFGLLFRDVRKIKLNTFPYIIFYQVIGLSVHIYGVIHTKRKPAVYKKRPKNFCRYLLYNSFIRIYQSDRPRIYYFPIRTLSQICPIFD